MANKSSSEKKGAKAQITRGGRTASKAEGEEETVEKALKNQEKKEKGK